jgi:2-polyprenyl-3-methyl-5-hydroxy-6-metoxy-1,4-benzoquinol methylase
MQLVCPEHQTSLILNDQDSFVCSYGCKYHIINKIPRFVSSDNYATSFGVQWNKFGLTQLDSYTGLSISEDRLTRLAGGSIDIFKYKNVLEAGCGAGRFTEIMLKNKANVFACDLSNAIEANFSNCNKYDNYFVCQADILNLPVKSDSFDVVVCIGVIQHTPNPEETIKKLISYLKPGGLLIFDHYTYGYPISISRRFFRKNLLKISVERRFIFVSKITNILWPLHVKLYKNKHYKIISKLRNFFLKISPIVDYHDSYPQLNSELLFQWAFLDTHDTLTDKYKHLRSVEEIEKILESNGINKHEVYYAGNGVEARAFKAAV